MRIDIDREQSITCEAEGVTDVLVSALFLDRFRMEERTGQASDNFSIL
jgi:hypothetical protein